MSRSASSRRTIFRWDLIASSAASASGKLKRNAVSNNAGTAMVHLRCAPGCHVALCFFILSSPTIATKHRLSDLQPESGNSGPCVYFDRCARKHRVAATHSVKPRDVRRWAEESAPPLRDYSCLLYTSDAA